MDLQKRKKILFLEPFYGGSHKNFADGLKKHSRHEISIFTMPARFWKWRMRGASLHFSRVVADLKSYDGVLATDLMSLADFISISRGNCPPTLLYFHESQITYPLSAGESFDVHFGITDITSALCADRVLFNSFYHRDAFFEKLPGFLQMLPEYNCIWVVDEIRKKSGVVHPGCDFSDETIFWESKPQPPIIVWNHRWEHDKNPGDFFAVMDELANKKLDFSMAILGERFARVPQEFSSARKRHEGRIVQYGYAPSKEEYVKWLKRGSVVVSTANQENFGISVVEAVRHGCFPFLPRRLSYPELIGQKYHELVLYGGKKQLVNKLERYLRFMEPFEPVRHELAEHVGQFAWKRQALMFDEEIDRLVEGRKPCQENYIKNTRH